MLFFHEQGVYNLPMFKEKVPLLFPQQVQLLREVLSVSDVNLHGIYPVSMGNVSASENDFELSMDSASEGDCLLTEQIASSYSRLKVANCTYEVQEKWQPVYSKKSKLIEQQDQVNSKL